MKCTDDQLTKIYDRTSGRCHICFEPLAFSNYGKPRTRGAWEVDHSKARARGGTDGLNNLYPAHISCNRQKNTKSSRAARRKHGRKRAPLSIKARERAKRSNGIAGAILGAAAGSMLGPAGAWLGGAVGAKLGYDEDPDD